MPLLATGASSVCCVQIVMRDASGCALVAVLCRSIAEGSDPDVHLQRRLAELHDQLRMMPQRDTALLVGAADSCGCLGWHYTQQEPLSHAIAVAYYLQVPERWLHCAWLPRDCGTRCPVRSSPRQVLHRAVPFEGNKPRVVGEGRRLGMHSLAEGQPVGHLVRRVLHHRWGVVAPSTHTRKAGGGGGSENL